MMIALVGGREIHPINSRVGGFYRAPSRVELKPLRRAAASGRATPRSRPSRWAARSVSRLRAGLRIRGAVGRPDDVPDRPRAARFKQRPRHPAEAYDEHFVEEQVPHSNALHVALRDGGSYMVGPMARYSLAFDRSRRWRVRPLADGWARAVVPKPVPEHHRAWRRAVLCDAKRRCA